MTVRGNVSYAGKVKLRADFQSKRIMPSEETRVVIPDNGFSGLSKLVVYNVTAAIDPDIVPENIKEGVEILGVVGTMTFHLQSKTVTPAESTQEITPDSGFDGLSGVTVEPVLLQTKTVYPSLQSETYRPDSGYTGFSRVTVKAVTADIDPAIQPENIRKNVNILGVSGSLTGDFETVDSMTGELTGSNINQIFKTFVIPGSSVTSISDNAFKLCTGLESITIPVTVTNIGQDAFYGCSGLTDVYYAGTQAQWDAVTISTGNDPLLNASLHCQS